jgi:ribonuclease T
MDSFIELEREFSKPLGDIAEGAIAERFRGFLPVVIDVETGGFNSATDALLEIAAIPILMTTDGEVVTSDLLECNVIPFEGANIEDSALQFTGIDLQDPDRDARPEGEALRNIFQPIRRLVKAHNCKRAILVAHNAHFDLGFVNAASERCDIKRNPFHPFSCFDTATLAGLAYGQTVLARACEEANIEFDSKEAHSAAYDAKKTAKLFCKIVNKWHRMQ